MRKQISKKQKEDSKKGLIARKEWNKKAKKTNKSLTKEMIQSIFEEAERYLEPIVCLNNYYNFNTIIF
jgi:hypothetical protein